MPMMAITTNSSIRVKPFRRDTFIETLLKKIRKNANKSPAQANTK
jgi:hypothetical protein